jgi:hypothetical protein
MSKLFMLDLFAGLGGASQAMKGRGWDVVTVDNDPAFNCTITADLAAWSWEGRRPNLVWASPPCQEFSRHGMPWIKGAPPPSLELVKAAARIVRECDPDWWVVENVRGSIRFFKSILGPVVRQCGPFFLWGRFPSFPYVHRAKKKESWSSRNAAERAMVPAALSLALARACEPSLFSGV